MSRKMTVIVSSAPTIAPRRKIRRWIRDISPRHDSIALRAYWIGCTDESCPSFDVPGKTTVLPTAETLRNHRDRGEVAQIGGRLCVLCDFISVSAVNVVVN